MSSIMEIMENIERELPRLGSGRLPSVRAWAAKWDVGTRTVQSALHELVARKILDVRRGSGFWRNGEVPQAASVAVRPGAVEIASALKSELSSGKHPWDVPLPSVKELSGRWSCHRQTASKALGMVCRSGLVVRRGNAYLPVRPTARRERLAASILCVGAHGLKGELRMDSDRESDFWRELGAQAALAGLSLIRQPWNGEPVRVGPSVVGVVASSWHLPDSRALFDALDRVDVPVCVWIEDPASHRGSVRNHPRIRFHDQGYGKVAGELVARHLVDLGHRKLAYLSPWHGSLWSRNRLRGVSAACAHSGAEVQSFCLGGISEWDRMGPAWSDRGIWEDFPLETVERVVEGSADALREAAIGELAWNRIRRDMEPILRAVRDSDATAWIGANDACALVARDWALASGVSIPAEVSVAGFDDTTSSLRADLTSYRFDSGAMVRSMLRQILSSGIDPALSRHDGVVVARGSTAPRSWPGSRGAGPVAAMPRTAKTTARATGDRKVDLIALKEVQPVTGYIRGGVTALGMKKSFPVVADETIQLWDKVCVSAGVRGTQIEIAPNDYLRATGAVIAEIARPK